MTKTQDYAGLCQWLRWRAATLNTGTEVSPDDFNAMGYYSRDCARLDERAADAIEALQAELARVKAERDEANKDCDLLISWMDPMEAEAVGRIEEALAAVDALLAEDQP